MIFTQFVGYVGLYRGEKWDKFAEKYPKIEFMSGSVIVTHVNPLTGYREGYKLLEYVYVI